MAKRINDKKGFLVIETSLTECVEKIGGIGICDYCNSSSFTGYYIAVLNCWYCEKCYKNWTQRAKRYEEDSHIEKRNFDYYAKLLEI